MTIDSGARQSNKISLTALRVVPFAVLVKALVSIAVVIYTIISLKSAAQGNAADRGADAIVLTISYESMHLMTIASYIILIAALTNLKLISDKLGKARYITMVTAALYFAGLLISVLEVESYSNNYDAAASVLFWLNYTVTTAKALGLVAAIFYVTKGFAERLATTGYTSDAKRVAKAGLVYLVVNIVLLTLTVLAEIAESTYLEYIVGTSTAICAVLELYIFFTLIKAPSIIWQDSRKEFNR